MRSKLADIFRLLFKISFFRNRFFGIHKRIFAANNLFRGINKRIQLKNGITLDLKIDDWVQENLFFLGEYEQAELRFAEKSLKPGDVFMDIGANIGLYTLCAFKAVGDSGRVISFEPLEENFKSLSKHVSINHGRNIVLEQMAISDRKEEIEIFYDDRELNLGMASSYLTSHTHSEKVAAISIDQYIDLNPMAKVDFIKIDIEGGEYKALLGMQNTLIRHSPILLIEINPEVLSGTEHDEQDMLRYLQDLGYQEHVIEDNRNPMNKAFIRQKV